MPVPFSELPPPPGLGNSTPALPAAKPPPPRVKGDAIKAKLPPPPSNMVAVSNKARAAAAKRNIAKGFKGILAAAFLEDALWYAADLIDMADAEWAHETASYLREKGDQVDQVKATVGALIFESETARELGWAVDPGLSPQSVSAILEWYDLYKKQVAADTGKQLGYDPPTTPVPEGPTAPSGGYSGDQPIGNLPALPADDSVALPALPPPQGEAGNFLPIVPSSGCADVRSGLELVASLRGKLRAISVVLGVSPVRIRAAMKLWSGLTDCEKNLMLSDLEVEL